MAAITTTGGSIIGVAAADVVELEFGNNATMKHVTVEELLRGTGIAACVPVWDDLRFPAQSINPPGTLDGPTVDATETGFPGTLVFVGNADRILCGVAQMPHAWEKGTAIRPHIHWSKLTGSAGAVTWELFIRILGFAGDAPGAWSSALPVTYTEGSPLVTDEMLISGFGDVDMTGQRESAMFAWRLYRRGSTDADAASVRLFEFDIHYQIDKLGTIPEIPS